MFHISNGNSKIGHVPNCSLTPGRSCSAMACKTCLKEGCYACKSYRQYPNVRAAWDENTNMALTDLMVLKAELMEYFGSLSAPRYFRVHVGGDFITAAYAKMWADIARANPHTNFLAYTKQFDNIRGINFPENFSLVLSDWQGCEIPEDLQKLYPVAYCVPTVADAHADTFMCPGNCDKCGKCWHLKADESVTFIKH